MIHNIQPLGQLVGACSMPGDTPQDRRKPAHPNGIPVSRGRWLLLYCTRGLRGGDDDCSIIYQLREDHPTGRLVKEGRLAEQVEWQPFPGCEQLLPESAVCVKEHSHVVAFGVPKGALIHGWPVRHENVFVLKWRVLAKILKKSNNHCFGQEALSRGSQDVEWMQVRLNDAEDDLEILSPARPLRPVSGVLPWPRMNQSYVSAVPWNDDRSQWVDCNYFDARVAPLRYRFDPSSGLYEWVETGPCLPSEIGLTEPSLLRAGSDWLICTRPAVANRGDVFRGPPIWYRVNDLFGETARPVQPSSPVLSSTPRTAFNCPDGTIRLISNSHEYAPTASFRDPLFCWDIDAETLEARGQHELFSSKRAGLDLLIPMADFGSLLPHLGGSEQILLHRLFVMSNDYDRMTGDQRIFLPRIKSHEFQALGVYACSIVYDQEYPPAWEFGMADHSR